MSTKLIAGLLLFLLSPPLIGFAQRAAPRPVVKPVVKPRVRPEFRPEVRPIEGPKPSERTPSRYSDDRVKPEEGNARKPTEGTYAHPPIDPKPYESGAHKTTPRQPFETNEFISLRPRSQHEEIPPENERWKPLHRERILRVELHAGTTENNVSSTPIKDPRLVVLLPRGPEYEKVFDQQYSQKAKAEMDVAEIKFKQLLPDNVDIVNDTSSADLLNKIHESRGRLVIIVGHSVDTAGERRIKLPDGTAISESEIHRAGLESGAVCIVITCHGKDLGLKRNISLTEAYNLCDRAIKAYQSQQVKTLGELVYLLREEAAAWKQPGVTVSVAIAMGGVTMILAFIVDSEGKSLLKVILLVAGAASGTIIISLGVKKIHERRVLKRLATQRNQQLET